MFNNPFADRDDKEILHRLQHPEEETEQRKMSRNLYLRNILNTLFIILSLVAMIGIVVSDKGRGLMVWYGVGLFAVIIKMIEAVLRMPGMKK